MKNAVTKLFTFIDSKTNHGSKSIQKIMSQLCAVEYLFTSKEAQQEFAQVCSNFDKYCKEQSLTSWGRTIFTNWWLANVKGFNTIPVVAPVFKASKLEAYFVIVGELNEGFTETNPLIDYPSEEQIEEFLKDKDNYIYHAKVEKRYRLID